MSDKDTPDDRQDAEPVDAEFEPAPEPAPDGAEEDAAGPRERSSGGGLKRVLFVIVAAAIGGAAGFVLSRHLPPEAVAGGELTALEERIAALENAGEPDLAGLRERVSELETTLAAREDLPDRVDALAAAIETLEAGAAGSGPGGDAAESLTQLQSRLDDAFSGVRSRLDALEDTVATAQSEAEAARSAARQANTALSEISAGTGADDAPSDPRLAGLSGRIDALGERVEALSGAVRTLDGLPGRVEALAGQIEDQGASAGAVSPDELDAVRTRLEAFVRRVNQLARQVEALQAAPSEPAGLAARALGFAALSEAASGSEPFAVEVEALARVWPGAPGLEALRAVAREGAPTPDRLEDSFPSEALRQATGETRTYFGVLRVARDDEAGPAAAITQALAEDDLAEAARIVSELDEAGLEALGGWRDGLADRLAVRDALKEQSAALAAAGGGE